MDLLGYVTREQFIFAQSDFKYHRHDGTGYHQNTMERPRISDPTECNHAICHLNGTDNPQLDGFDYSNSFTFFEIIQKQRLFESKQPPLRITKLNNFQHGAFAWTTNCQLVLNAPPEKIVCCDCYEYMRHVTAMKSSSAREIETTYVDIDNKIIYYGHTCPCLYDYGFCKPTL